MIFAVLAFSTAIVPYLVRLRVDYIGTKHEIVVTTLLSVGLHRANLKYYWTSLSDFSPQHLLWISVLALVPSLWYFEFFLWRISSRRAAGKPTSGPLDSTNSFLKPLIFPSKTSHVRLFPQKHGFSYSYLLVGIPIGWRGSIGSLLSADTDTFEADGSATRRRGWLSVEGADYLYRGYDIDGLQGKLASYLKSQDEDYRDYPHVYLVTAPRFLGYSFNPVSFWYLYDERMTLKAMILEVNNTFDERRVYFLKGSLAAPSSRATDASRIPSDDEVPLHAPGLPNHNTKYDDKHTTIFRDSWSKDFHVSPFSSRKGSYALTAYNPMSQLKIDNTITLSSSKGHPKLVAKVFSTGEGVDPSKIGSLGGLKLVAAWSWVGFVTFPRIVREAAKLFFRRKLHVWYRPEVSPESIGRKETRDERVIASCFRAFLEAMVEKSDLQAPVNYTAAMSSIPETFCPLRLRGSSQSNVADASVDPIELKIITPLFYSQLVRYSHISEFITNSLLTLPAKSQTFYISVPQSLLKLLDTRLESTGFKEIISLIPSPGSSRWRFLRWLRNIFPREHVTSLPRGTMSTAQDIRPFPLSLLDEFAQQSQDQCLANGYRKVVVKLLVSDIIAFGQPVLLDTLDWLVRVVLCYVFAISLGTSISQVNGTEVYFRREVLYDLAPPMRIIAGCLGIHLWWGLKTLT